MELRAPAASEYDASFLRTCMDTGKIFAQVLDPVLRKTIINNICGIDRLIPSLRTFLEDIERLEPCVKAVRILLDLKDESTIYRALHAIFARSHSEQQHPLRQDGENHFVQIEGDTDHFEFGYKQLWIYAMRHFPNLVHADAKREPAKESPYVKKPISILWYRFARLALRLGFRSPRMELLGSTSAIDETIKECLFWSEDTSKTGASIYDQVAEIRERLQIETDAPPEMAPSLVTESSDFEVENRCGRAFDASSHNLQRELFIRWLYDTREPRGKYITASFVQRAIFHAFFGHTIPCRDSVASSRKHTNDSIPEHEIIGAEAETVSSDVLSVDLGKASKLKDHPCSGQGTSNTILATRFDVKPSPGFTEILSPRGGETGFQRSLDEIIHSGVRSPDQDIASGGLSKSFKSRDFIHPKAPKAQSRKSESSRDFDRRAPSKRITEMVSESQSCIHDCIPRSLTRAERKNPKRSFHEYSTDPEDTYPQRTLVNSDEVQNTTAKRHRLLSD